MHIALHIGAHCTDEDFILKTLLVNRDALAGAGIVVPEPGRYRPVIRETLQILKEDAPTEQMQEAILDALLDEDKATRVVLSHDSFLCVPGMSVGDGALYPMAGRKTPRLRNLFAHQELSFHIALRDPATFIPSVFERAQETEFANFIADVDPMALRWSSVISRIREAVPDASLTVWCAAVVLVFAAVLSMAKGFERTMTLAGSVDTAIIIRAGSTSEMASGMSSEQIQVIESAPGILRDDQGPVVSAELFVIVDIALKATGTGANVPFRGVGVRAFDVRDATRLVEGRMFETGKNELIVGRAAQSEFEGLDLGATIRFGRTEWQVVGVFEANGGVAESEVWTDIRVLQGAYRRGNSFQTARARLDSPDAVSGLSDTLKNDPRIDVDVFTEREFYSSQAQGTATFIRVLGYPITFLMAVGAVFGALNSMYSSVSTRGKEIATLRALGFGPLSVLLSTIIESTLLALVGGLLGGAIAFIAFNGYTVSTLSSASFSQVVFDFAVTPDLLMQGLTVALVIGFVGGFLPALRAARLPVAQALREL